MKCSLSKTKKIGSEQTLEYKYSNKNLETSVICKNLSPDWIQSLNTQRSSLEGEKAVTNKKRKQKICSFSESTQVIL